MVMKPVPDALSPVWASEERHALNAAQADVPDSHTAWLGQPCTVHSVADAIQQQLCRFTPR
eukprot:1156620-Pelagomonas_calceolata.AAC.4